MDHYHLPLPVMNGYFKQVTPPQAISDSESGEYFLNKLTKFKKNGCKIYVIEYNPVDNRHMAPVWDLFINWEKWIKSLVSGSKCKLFHLQRNVTPTQSQSNASIASITSNIVSSCVTASTRTKFCIPLCVPFLALQFQESWVIASKFLQKKEFLSMFIFSKGDFPGIPFCRN